MQPVTRQDIALLFVRALAVFALYQPFLMMCSMIGASIIELLGPSMKMVEPNLTIVAFWYLVLGRLIAAVVLWRLAPWIGSLVSSPSPAPARTTSTTSAHGSVGRAANY
jgi:hypothetical protein